MRKKIGVVGVDSGQLIITDPCYVDDWEGTEFISKEPYKQKEEYPYSYDGACQATLSPASAGQLRNDAGVAFSTGYGDGVYPVYATYNSEGRIMSVTVEFMSGDDDEEDEDE